MQTDRLAAGISVVSGVGTVTAVAAFFVAGDPTVPLSLGGVPAPAFAGVAGAFLTAAGLARLAIMPGWSPSDRGILAATLFAVPVAATLVLLRPLLGVATGEGAGTLDTAGVAAGVGLAALFYPMAAAYAAGAAPEVADDALTVAASVAGAGVVVVLLAVQPDEPLAVGSVGMALAATLVVDLVAGYPLFRLGRAVRSAAETRRRQSSPDWLAGRF